MRYTEYHVLRIASIVEGHGDVGAVPVLLRRIANTLTSDRPLKVLRPIRVPRTRLLRPGEMEGAIELAARQTTAGDCILVLIDADRDCPKELAPALLDRARQQRPDREIQVVLAKSEYESWFLAAAVSLRRRRGLPADLEPPPDPEKIRDAKGWLSRHLPRDQSYRETLHQAPLTQHMDLDRALTAPSFDKLWRDLESLLGAGSRTDR